MTECTHQSGISHKRAFNYCDPHVLKKFDAIISLVQNRKPQYLNRTYKFGVELPRSATDAHAIEKKNGNNFWDEGIAKEVNNVQLAFDVVPNGHRMPQNDQLSISIRFLT